MDNNISVNGLVKQYSNFKIDNINFDVPQGTVVGLLGENGAGKTTILKSILDLIEFDEGSIDVLGKKNILLTSSDKENIGTVLEDNYLPEDLNLLQICKMMSKIYTKWDEDKFKNYVKIFKLPLNIKIKDMSYGMKRKSEFICELSHDPQILILDEVTNGLDVTTREEFVRLILNFTSDRKRSVLISTHILSDLEKISDYILYIKQGKVLFFEKTKSLIHDYGIIKCNNEDLKRIENYIIQYRKLDSKYHVFVNNVKEIKNRFPNILIEKTNLEEMMIILEKGDCK